MSKKKKEPTKPSTGKICYSNNIPGVTILLKEFIMTESLLQRVISECQTSLFYHKFIIHGGESYEKNYILKSIMDAVYPITFMPVHFTDNYITNYFLARNCLDFIMKIISLKFQIRHHLEPTKPFQMIIMANCIISEEVPVEDNSSNIQDVIKKRFKKESNTLDLNNFGDDIDLNEYCPLFDQKFFKYVIKESVELAPKILDLQNNYIKDISFINLLKMSVEVLDLGNNEIEDLSALSSLAEFPNLKELTLIGNPLCKNYNSYNYVVEVKKYCPNLEKLDGANVVIPAFKKNFVCHEEAEDLAAQFIDHFFNIYDSSNRGSLMDLYDPYAIFSVNSKIIQNQKSSDKVILDHYGIKNPYAVYGIIDILKLFQEFPKSYHDPYPIVCDVIMYTETFAHLVICGIFKELAQILSFNRSFFFKRTGQRFLITNEQLHVSNALDFQLGWSFGFPTDINITGNPLPYFYDQYKELEELLQKLTNMNLEYCQKYLTFCNYDLKKTLNLFSELHINNEVPQEAFEKKSIAEDKPLEIPICEALQKKISSKQKVISLKAIWDTLNSERLESNSDPPTIMNPTIYKMYKKSHVPPSQPPTNFSIPQATKQPLNFPSAFFTNTFNTVDVINQPNVLPLQRGLETEYPKFVTPSIKQNESSTLIKNFSFKTDMEKQKESSTSSRSYTSKTETSGEKRKDSSRSSFSKEETSREKRKESGSSSRSSSSKTESRDKRKESSPPSRRRRMEDKYEISHKRRFEQNSSRRDDSEDKHKNSSKSLNESPKRADKSSGSNETSNKTGEIQNKISFALSTPVSKEENKVKDPLVELAARMAKYKEMALKKIAELKVQPTSTGGTPSLFNSKNETKINVFSSKSTSSSSSSQRKVYNEVPPPIVYTKKGAPSRFNQLPPEAGKIYANKNGKSVQVPHPSQLFTGTQPYAKKVTGENSSKVLNKAVSDVTKVVESDSKKNIPSPQQTTIQPQLQAGPLKHDDIIKLRQNLIEKMNLIKPVYRVDNRVTSKTLDFATPLQVSQSKNTLVGAASSSTGIQSASSMQSEILKNEGIKNMREALQKQKEKLLNLTNQLVTSLGSDKLKSIPAQSSPGLLPIPAQSSTGLLPIPVQSSPSLLPTPAQSSLGLLPTPSQSSSGNASSIMQVQPTSFTQSAISRPIETSVKKNSKDNENVSSAVEVIRLRNEQSYYEFLIPKELVGRFMGTHKIFIKLLKDQANTVAMVEKHPTNSKMNIVFLGGTLDGIDIALRMIREKFPLGRYPFLSLRMVHFPPKPVSSYLQEHPLESTNGDQNATTGLVAATGGKVSKKGKKKRPAKELKTHWRLEERQALAVKAKIWAESEMLKSSNLNKDQNKLAIDPNTQSTSSSPDKGPESISSNTTTSLMSSTSLASSPFKVPASVFINSTAISNQSTCSSYKAPVVDLYNTTTNFTEVQPYDAYENKKQTVANMRTYVQSEIFRLTRLRLELLRIIATANANNPNTSPTVSGQTIPNLVPKEVNTLNTNVDNTNLIVNQKINPSQINTVNESSNDKNTEIAVVDIASPEYKSATNNKINSEPMENILLHDDSSTVPTNTMDPQSSTTIAESDTSKKEVEKVDQQLQAASNDINMKSVEEKAIHNDSSTAPTNSKDDGSSTITEPDTSKTEDLNVDQQLQEDSENVKDISENSTSDLCAQEVLKYPVSKKNTTFRQRRQEKRRLKRLAGTTETITEEDVKAEVPDKNKNTKSLVKRRKLNDDKDISSESSPVEKKSESDTSDKIISKKKPLQDLHTFKRIKSNVLSEESGFSKKLCIRLTQLPNIQIKREGSSTETKSFTTHKDVLEGNQKSTSPKQTSTKVTVNQSKRNERKIARKSSPANIQNPKNIFESPCFSKSEVADKIKKEPFDIQIQLDEIRPVIEECVESAIERQPENSKTEITLQRKPTNIKREVMDTECEEFTVEKQITRSSGSNIQIKPEISEVNDTKYLHHTKEKQARNINKETSQSSKTNIQIKQEKTGFTGNECLDSTCEKQAQHLNETFNKEYQSPNKETFKSVIQIRLEKTKLVASRSTVKKQTRKLTKKNVHSSQSIIPARPKKTKAIAEKELGSTLGKQSILLTNETVQNSESDNMENPVDDGKCMVRIAFKEDVSLKLDKEKETVNLNPSMSETKANNSENNKQDSTSVTKTTKNLNLSTSIAITPKSENKQKATSIMEDKDAANIVPSTSKAIASNSENNKEEKNTANLNISKYDISPSNSKKKKQETTSIAKEKDSSSLNTSKSAISVNPDNTQKNLNPSSDAIATSEDNKKEISLITKEKDTAKLNPPFSEGNGTSSTSKSSAISTNYESNNQEGNPTSEAIVTNSKNKKQETTSVAKEENSTSVNLSKPAASSTNSDNKQETDSVATEKYSKHLNPSSSDAIATSKNSKKEETSVTKKKDTAMLNSPSSEGTSTGSKNKKQETISVAKEKDSVNLNTTNSSAMSTNYENSNQEANPTSEAIVSNSRNKKTETTSVEKEENSTSVNTSKSVAISSNSNNMQEADLVAREKYSNNLNPSSSDAIASSENNKKEVISVTKEKDDAMLNPPLSEGTGTSSKNRKEETTSVAKEKDSVNLNTSQPAANSTNSVRTELKAKTPTKEKEAATSATIATNSANNKPEATSVTKKKVNDNLNPSLSAVATSSENKPEEIKPGKQVSGTIKGSKSETAKDESTVKNITKPNLPTAASEEESIKVVSKEEKGTVKVPKISFLDLFSSDDDDDDAMPLKLKL